MKYICAQPATLHYAWQIDAMLYSFKETHVRMEDVHIVCSLQEGKDPYFDKLLQKYPGVLFSFYQDTRIDKSYVSSIRPHILKKHFTAFPELSKEIIFYHDSDIVFTKNICFCGMKSDDNICFLSDTVSYIGYEYILSKGEDVLDRMCEIVGIDKETVRLNQINSGGAQYVLKGIDKYFWYDVEKDATNLFKSITELSAKKKADNPEYHELQIWCADMWAVLWNLWKKGKETRVSDELEFSWATQSIDLWDKNAIFHNAGVTSDNKELFFKGNYINRLPDKNLKISKNFCSYNYYNIIKEL